MYLPTWLPWLTCWIAFLIGVVALIGGLCIVAMWATDKLLRLARIQRLFIEFMIARVHHRDAPIAAYVSAVGEMVKERKCEDNRREIAEQAERLCLERTGKSEAEVAAYLTNELPTPTQEPHHA